MMKINLVIFGFVSLLTSIFLATLFYYFLFWKPLQSNKELFPAELIGVEKQGYLRILPNGKVDVDEKIKKEYGIEEEEISRLQGKGDVYFIDGREREEFESSHIANAKHLRATDIKGTKQIKELFGLEDAQFKNSFFIVYCHDGTRSAQAIADMDMPNVKFLIEGVNFPNSQQQKNIKLPFASTSKDVFEEGIKNHDFTLTAQEALDFTKSTNAQFIDVRLYRKEVFPNACDFRIGNLSTEEYEKQLPDIMNLKGRDIIFIADIYPDLFYAKLLIQRLGKRYGFPRDKFFVLFSQSRTLYLRLKEKGLRERIISQGEHRFPDGIVVSADEVLKIEPGACLKMGENSRLVVKGKIIAKGTKEKPIIFESIKGYWRGIKIAGSQETPACNEFWKWFKRGDEEKERLFFAKIKEGNVFNYCEFKNVSTGDRKFLRENKWKAAIEAYDTAIHVSRSKFNDVLHIGGVLAQRSFVLVNDNYFLSNLLHKGINCTDKCVVIAANNSVLQQRKKNQSCADGIWIIDSVGLAAYNTIKGVCDDGIGLDGSSLVIIGNDIETSHDEGIDTGGGEVFIIDNSINNVPKDGILLSDGCEGVLSSNQVRYAQKGGVALRDGAKASAEEMDIQHNAVGIRLFQGVPCALSDDDYQKVKSIVSGMKNEEIRDKVMEDISGSRDLLEALDSSYDRKESYWILNNKDFDEIRMRWKILKELFKLIDGSEIKYLVNKDTKTHPFCTQLKNSLFLTKSSIKNNAKEMELSGEYCFQAEGLCAEECNSPLVDELNSVSAVSGIAKRIVAKARELK